MGDHARLPWPAHPAADASTACRSGRGLEHSAALTRPSGFSPCVPLSQEERAKGISREHGTSLLGLVQGLRHFPLLILTLLS